MDNGAGVMKPAPEFAGQIVVWNDKYTGKEKRLYFDEKGWANDIKDDDEGNQYFTVRHDGLADGIYLRPDGKFPSIPEGRAQNAIEAASLLQFARASLKESHKQQCISKVKEGLLDPTSLVLTRPLAINEEDIRRRPRSGVQLKASVTARARGGNIVPASMHCFLARDGNTLNMRSAFLIN
jgi:hypothetical protein